MVLWAHFAFSLVYLHTRNVVVVVVIIIIIIIINIMSC